MTVYFIGAGPGAADLLTVRASRLIRRCGTCLYEGATVPRDILAPSPPTARIVDTGGMPAGDVVAELRAAHQRGDDVARLHAGDPSTHPAVDEQVRALDAEGIPWEMVPGVTTFAAAMPPGEAPATVYSSGATAVIHLAAGQLPRAVGELTPVYGPDCPVAVVAHAPHGDEVTARGTLADIADRVAGSDPSRGAVIMVGRLTDPGGGDPGPRGAVDTDHTVDAVGPDAGAPPGRILVLGGTSEGRQLADRMVTAGLDVVTSLAGRVSRPRLPRGEVRTGGFGGPEGLADWLYRNGVSAVIDATHPFAERISASAAQATDHLGLPLLRLHRPAWTPRPDDDWIRVADLDAAARVVRERFRRPMLTVGRQGLGAFAGDPHGSYLIRCVEPPSATLPHSHLLVLDRGPFSADSERTLISRHRIDVLVTKNSGGRATEAKLAAARELRIPVVMVDRPPAPPAETVHTVDEAALWLVARFGSRLHGTTGR